MDRLARLRSAPVCAALFVLSACATESTADPERASTDGGESSTASAGATGLSSTDGDVTDASTIDASSATSSVGATSSGSPEALDSSSSSTGLDFCECFDALVEESPDTCRTPPPPCDVAADCCPDDVPDGFMCLQDYPFLYACEAGTCAPLQCDSGDQCTAYGALLGATTTTCAESQWRCGSSTQCQFTYPDQPGCSSDADCCVAPEPYACGQDYPFLATCVAGECTSAACESDAQCETYAAQSGLLNLGCSTAVTPECWELPGAPAWEPLPTCRFALACSVDADCCPATLPDGFTCLEDYPYLYSCDGGHCATRLCDSDAECAAYGEQSGLPISCG